MWETFSLLSLMWIFSNLWFFYCINSTFLFQKILKSQIRQKENKNTHVSIYVFLYRKTTHNILYILPYLFSMHQHLIILCKWIIWVILWIYMNIIYLALTDSEILHSHSQYCTNHLAGIFSHANFFPLKSYHDFSSRHWLNVCYLYLFQNAVSLGVSQPKTCPCLQISSFK